MPPNKKCDENKLGLNMLWFKNKNLLHVHNNLLKWRGKQFPLYLNNTKYLDSNLNVFRPKNPSINIWLVLLNSVISNFY